jgi:hypothetical protein
MEEFALSPVIPADKAQGFGWAKASDLANRKNETK